jgi:hypothetical protein
MAVPAGEFNQLPADQRPGNRRNRSRYQRRASRGAGTGKEIANHRRATSGAAASAETAPKTDLAVQRAPPRADKDVFAVNSLRSRSARS